MDILADLDLWSLWNLLWHMKDYSAQFIHDNQATIYPLLFMILFCETGLVVTPILPGDSLLFAVGTFAARGSLDLWTSLLLLSAAAVLGDNLMTYLAQVVSLFNSHMHPGELAGGFLPVTPAPPVPPLTPPTPDLISVKNLVE